MTDDSTDALQRRLREAEETLAAIRAGDVDAVVVDDGARQQVYCLEPPDQPFRIFIERMQEGALTLGSDGAIVYCNRFFADLIGDPSERVRGRLLTDFVVDEDRAAVEQMTVAALTGPLHGECRLQPRQGAARPVQLAFTPLPAEVHRMSGVVVTDLSERERAKRLEAERFAAEEARSARDQFLAVVSHELRTPLNAVLGWTQALQQKPDVPAAVKRGLTVIARNAWAQAQLIDDLLDVSRILAGKLRLENKPVDLATVTAAAIDSVQPSADARRMDLQCTLPDTPLWVRGDADRLQQIVANLLTNAVKFSHEGGRIEVTAAQRDDHAEVRVRDHGIGIAADSLPRLFELYHQIERNPARSHGGLGLGLAITRQLTDLHGGSISVESAGEGQGASFTASFPLLRSAPAEQNASPAPEAARAGLSRLRLLLVEDDQDSRELLQDLLESTGARVVAVATAMEALEHLEHHPTDLLVSDIGLPGMDGYELIRRIRASGHSSATLPAIAVTAFVGPEDRRLALLAGYQVHVPKPIDGHQLVGMIATLGAARLSPD